MDNETQVTAASDATQAPIDWKRSERYGFIDNDETDPIKNATMKQGIFTIKIRVAYEYDTDPTDGRGHFSETKEPGAIRNDYAGFGMNYVGEGMPWFIPDRSLEQRAAWYATDHGPGIDTYGEWKALTTDEAMERAKRELHEDMRLASGADTSMVMVHVTIFVRNIPLAHDAMWGVEIDSEDSPYIDEMARMIIDSTLDTAKQKVAEIRDLLAGI